MPNAHVTAFAVGFDELATVSVARDGSYELTIDTTGIVRLHVNGLHHEGRFIPLYLPRPDTIDLDVSLATYSYRDNLSDVAVVGEFNNFMSSPSRGVPMKKQSDGTYAATVPAPGDSLSYGFSNVQPGPIGSIPSPHAETYVRESRGGGYYYRSVIAASTDSVQVTFDPEKRVTAEEAGGYHFRDADSVPAQFARAASHFEDRSRAFLEAKLNAHFGSVLDGGSPEDYRARLNAFDWSSSHETIANVLSESPPSELRGAYLVTYLANTQRPDSSYAQEALNVIEPSSPTWAYGGRAGRPGLALQQALRTSGQPGAYASYAEAVLRTTPNDDLKPPILLHLLQQAAKTGDETRQDLFYTWLKSEYPDTGAARRATEYAPGSNVQKGKPVPSFEVSALYSEKKTFTPASFEGQYLLIDFWAPWCAPCYSELPHLRAARTQYKETLTILSVSLYGTRASVRGTLEKYEMPWEHAIADGYDSRIAEQFDVVRIPKPILIGPDGTIRVADRTQLLGETLLETLDRLIGESGESSSESGR